MGLAILILVHVRMQEQCSQRFYMKMLQRTCCLYCDHPQKIRKRIIITRIPSDHGG